MSGPRTHTSDGRRLSSMTHAKRAHTCSLCGQVGYGNGFEAQHGRAHVRRGEAVEVARWFDNGTTGGTMGRAFLAPDDPKLAWYEERGYERVEP